MTDTRHEKKVIALKPRHKKSSTDSDSSCSSGGGAWFTTDAYRLAGARVAEYRRSHGRMPQRTLARKAGISVGSLQALESATRITGRSILDKVAQAIGLTVDQLMAEDPKQQVDARLAGLTAADIRIAFLFQRANGHLKIAIEGILLEEHTKQEAELKEGGALSALTAAGFPRTGTSSVDYEHAIRQAEADSRSTKPNGGKSHTA